MKYALRATVIMLIVTSSFYSCKQEATANAQANTKDTAASVQQINALLDSLNATAARADYNAYFDLYASDAIFTGTDATERWEKPAFMQWAKPYFDKGKAWNFSALQRHVYLDSTGELAWFDELLRTQMKICRGSGVVVKQGDDWKIKQYILSITMPNAVQDAATALKQPIEDSVITSLTK